MKYIIEIEDTPFEGLYKAKGFNTLVFNEKGLKKLKAASEEFAQHNSAGYALGLKEGEQSLTESLLKSYNDGLNCAWELAKKIVLPTRTQHDAFIYGKLKKIFGIGDYERILSKFSIFEVITKIKAYEENQKKAEAEIRVGDEVDDGVGLAVIIGIRDDGTYDGIANCGHVHITNVHKKTGRHFPEIEEIIRQINADERKPNVH